MYFSWEDVVENSYALQLKSKRLKNVPVHLEGRQKLQYVPPNWSIEHDEDLAQFLCAHTERDNDNLGSIKNYVESVDVSSYSVSCLQTIHLFCMNSNVV